LIFMGPANKFKSGFPSSSSMAGLRRSVMGLVMYIGGYIASSIALDFLFERFLPAYLPDASSYGLYVDYGLTLGFGYLIVSSIAGIVYWMLRSEYGHPTAAALRSTVKVMGIGALVAMVVGALSSPGAGLALGGFMGMVVGFASQRIMSQILSGLILSLTRPFMIEDLVELAGVKGVVEEVSLLFTTLRLEDGSRALLPNNSVLGSKVIKYPKKGLGSG